MRDYGMLLTLVIVVGIILVSTFVFIYYNEGDHKELCKKDCIKANSYYFSGTQSDLFKTVCQCYNQYGVFQIK